MRKLFFICFFFGAIFTVFADDFTQKAKNFWKYISKNENKIFSMNPQDQAFQMEIYEQIQLIDKNIFVMLGNEITDKKRDLIITAGGNPDYFDLCDKIVKLAPKYSKIRPISLFPPVDNIEPFAFGSVVLSIEEVRVNLAGDEKEVSLLFILPDNHLAVMNNDKSGQYYNVYMQVLHMMTQQVLGERLTAQRIVSADIAPLSTIMPYVPLKELRNVIK